MNSGITYLFSHCFCRSGVWEWHHWEALTHSLSTHRLGLCHLKASLGLEGLLPKWFIHMVLDICSLLAVGRRLRFFTTWVSPLDPLSILMPQKLAFCRGSDPRQDSPCALWPQQSQTAISSTSYWLHRSALVCLGGGQHMGKNSRRPSCRWTSTSSPGLCGSSGKGGIQLIIFKVSGLEPHHCLLQVTLWHAC